jgi:hypothetical protein
MRSSKNRSRSKANRPRSIGNIINRVFDSSGPDGKVRGTPQQIIEKYLFLARDAQLSNDRVAAENFLQHAEHYTRLLSEANRELAAEQEARQAQQGQQHHNNNQNGGNQNGGQQNGNYQGSGNQNNQQPRQNNDRNERRDDRGDYRAADPRDERTEYRSYARAEPDEQPAMAAFEPGLPDFVQQPLIVEESSLVETPEARQPRPPRDRDQQRNRETAPAAPAETVTADAPRADRGPRRPRAPRKPRETGGNDDGAPKDGTGEPREAAE